MKGHNYDHGTGVVCKKCGKVHVSLLAEWSKIPKTVEHKRHISDAKRGIVETQEHKNKIAAAIHAYLNNLSPEERRLKYTPKGPNAAKRIDVRRKISVALDGKKRPWSTGELNPSKRPEVREKIRRKAKQRFMDKNWRDKQMIVVRDNGFGYSHESLRHVDLKEKVCKVLISNGFSVELEKVISTDNGCYIVDIFAQKNNRNIMIECGNCDDGKIKNLREMFEVIHIPYNEETNVEELLV